MIEAYIDESGKTLVGRPLYAVAAFFGTRDQWRHFEDIWSPVLQVAGLPYYHGKDPKCDKLRHPMISAIRSSGVRGFTSSTFKDEYARAGHELKSTLGNHYAFLAVRAAIGVRDWAKANNAGPISFVLEAGQPNVEHVMRAIRTLIGPDVASVTCAGKQDFVGLQVADFLAHHTAALDVGLVWVQQLLGDGPGQVMWGHLDTAGIESASKGMVGVMRKHRHRRANRKRERKAQRPKG